MKTFLFSFFIFFTFCCSAQKHSQPKLEHIDNEKMNRQIDSSMKALDSLNSKINWDYKKGLDSVYNHLEEERNKRSLNEFMAMQKEQQEKEKKAAWLRIGIGIFFLGVLIFGLMRRRKKTAK